MKKRTRYNLIFWLLTGCALVSGVLTCLYAYRITPSKDAPLVLAALVLLTLCGLVFLILLYAPATEATSLFERWQAWVPGNQKPRADGYRLAGGVLCVLPGVVPVISALRFIQFYLGEGMSIRAGLYGIVMLAGTLLTLIALFVGFSRAFSHVTVVFMLLSPVLLQLFTGSDKPLLLWPLCGLLMALFVFARATARRYLFMYLFLLLTLPFAEILFHSGTPSAGMVWELVGLLFVGSGLYAVMDAYIAFTHQSRTELATATAQLEEAQAIHSQKEKMAALGQLIAGVAHEINTPMGAIKASAENMETSARAMFTGLIYKTRDFTDKDIEDFLTLADICSQSIREMRNTMETRRAKPRLTAFFNRINPATAPRVVDYLTNMEICGMEKIENQVEVFKNPKLLEILELIQAVFPYLNATQNVLYATGRVSKIVFALRSYSHTSLANERISFNIIENVQNVLVLYHNQMKHGIEVIWRGDEDIPLVYGNPDELGQVWSNLIQNAIQAMNGVGTLRVAAQSLTDGTVRMTFTDTGGGIRPENMDRIFETFFTTKPPGEGSGLGLDICRRIVEKHGGTITVDNKPGKGVTFAVTLPVKE